MVEIGDFSSTSSMAASAIYQRGGLVQFGFTNSHPDFTKGGDYMWSPSISQAEEQPMLAGYAVDELGCKKIGGPAPQHRLGHDRQEPVRQSGRGAGAEIVAVEGYLPDEKDFRSTLVRVRSAEPDSIVLEILLSRRRARSSGRCARWASTCRSRVSDRSIRPSSSSSAVTP